MRELQEQLMGSAVKKERHQVLGIEDSRRRI
jgi:hypothetical protein